MSSTKASRSTHAPGEPTSPGPGSPATTQQRVVFTQGGKGGTGKTTLVTALAEWYAAREVPLTLLDLDTENKARGSLQHYFRATAEKVHIHTPAGLDAFIDHLASGTPLLADMGAGSGQVTAGWFDTMHEDVATTGVAFTAIGVITPDPASVESVLAWAHALQGRVDYLVVENATSPQADFAYWRDAEQARRFREVFGPEVITMDYRLPELEAATRQHGVTLGAVAGRRTAVPELAKASLVMRAQAYRRKLFAEFDRVERLLMP